MTEKTELRIGYLHVRSQDIAPGDQFFYTLGTKANRDPDHARVTVLSVDPANRSMQVARTASLLPDGTPDALTATYTLPLVGNKDVFGGPKLDAANADPSLIQKGGFGYWWVGSPAQNPS